MRVLITGGAGFLGSHLCDRFLAEGHTVIAMDNLITGQHRQYRASGRPRAFQLHQARRHQLYLHRWAARCDPALRLARLAGRLLGAADPDAEGRRAGHAQGAGPGQSQGRALPAGLDLRGLWRPAGPPAARELLRLRQPDRPARRLRRGQALRRGDDHGVPSLPRRRYADRADLQHLWPAHAPARWPRRAELHPAGAARRAADRLWRRRCRRARSTMSTIWSRASTGCSCRTRSSRSTSATRASTRSSSSPR